jgi:hypothetical protein
MCHVNYLANKSRRLQLSGNVIRYLELRKQTMYVEFWWREGGDEDNIKVDLNEVDCGDRMITELTQDRALIL